MNKTIRILRAGLIAVAVLLAAACSTGGGTKKDGGTRKDSGASLEQRSIQRWEHLIAKRSAEAYEYLTPGYRETHPKETYAAAMGNRPVQWKKADFQGKTCSDEDTCVVHILITYELRMSAAIPGPVSGVSGQTENWIRIKGVWYYLPSE